jgi:hypothetical protein
LVDNKTCINDKLFIGCLPAFIEDKIQCCHDEDRCRIRNEVEIFKFSKEPK